MTVRLLEEFVEGFFTQADALAVVPSGELRDRPVQVYDAGETRGGWLAATGGVDENIGSTIDSLHQTKR